MIIAVTPLMQQVAMAIYTGITLVLVLLALTVAVDAGKKTEKGKGDEHLHHKSTKIFKDPTAPPTPTVAPVAQSSAPPAPQTAAPTQRPTPSASAVQQSSVPPALVSVGPVAQSSVPPVANSVAPTAPSSIPPAPQTVAPVAQSSPPPVANSVAPAAKSSASPVKVVSTAIPPKLTSASKILGNPTVKPKITIIKDFATGYIPFKPVVLSAPLNTSRLYVDKCIRDGTGQSYKKCNESNPKIQSQNWNALKACLGKYTQTRLDCMVTRNRAYHNNYDKWFANQLLKVDISNSTEPEKLKHLDCILKDLTTVLYPKCHSGCLKPAPPADFIKDWEHCSIAATIKFDECYYLFDLPNE